MRLKRRVAWDANALWLAIQRCGIGLPRHALLLGSVVPYMRRTGPYLSTLGGGAEGFKFGFGFLNPLLCELSTKTANCFPTILSSGLPPE